MTQDLAFDTDVLVVGAGDVTGLAPLLVQALSRAASATSTDSSTTSDGGAR